MKKAELSLYRDLVGEIKSRVRDAQHREAMSANAEMIRMYWDIGRMIAARQEEEGWGAGIIPRLAVELKSELPGVKGFSERNLGNMIRFARAYDSLEIGEKAVPQILQHGLQN